MFHSNNQKTRYLRVNSFNKKSLVLLLSILLTSCVQKQPEPNPEPIITPPPVEEALSPLPLDNLNIADYKFAQAALDQLGYNVLFIDGIWGPRSETAIQKFEVENQLITANGQLSELNFSRLSEMTNLNSSDFDNTISVKTKSGIAGKLDPNLILDDSPQLIITDSAYIIQAKPNPYSETVVNLPEGAGLYIINLQQGWYEVETLERERGYIQN